jgi:hypothetical protein
MKGGCCVCTAGKCIIVATFDENKGHSSAGCNDVIQEMAKYLMQISWPSGTQEAAGAGGSTASSWQPYIQTMLLAKGDIKDALICSAADGTVWASTPDFTVRYNNKLFYLLSYLIFCFIVESVRDRDSPRRWY